MVITDDLAMKTFGEQIGRLLRGGECLELIGDVGAGKTTFVKGLAVGLNVDDDVQSPSFTISREYVTRDGLTLAHYDFYRLHEAGVLSYELAESLLDPQTVTVVEWGETIGAVLPDERVVISIAYLPDSESRELTIKTAPKFAYLEEVRG